MDRILRNELCPGTRLSDSTLARELGVSRTPVREALLRMEREGFLEVDPGRGFFVKPRSADEVREVYPVLWTLEVLALRSCPAPTPDRLTRLDRINTALEGEEDPERRIDLDVEWHRTLVEACGNERLLRLIEAQKAVIRRYEYAFMAAEGMVPISTRTHDRITRLVEGGDLENALAHLESNWRSGMEIILGWMTAGEE